MDFPNGWITGREMMEKQELDDGDVLVSSNAGRIFVTDETPGGWLIMENAPEYER